MSAHERSAWGRTGIHSAPAAPVMPGIPIAAAGVRSLSALCPCCSRRPFSAGIARAMAPRRLQEVPARPLVRDCHY